MSYAHARLIIHANVCACRYHWILLIIEVDEGKVQVLDSLLKKDNDYQILKGMAHLFIFFARGQGLANVHQTG